MNSVEAQIATVLPDVFADTAPRVATGFKRNPVADSALLKRARAYLSKIPGAIEGQGGDAHTFTTACKLVRGFDLTDAEALDLMSDWNRTCTPPWSQQELEAKLDGARKYGSEPLGGRAVDRPFRDAAIPAVPMVVVPAESIFPFHTAAELSRDNPPAPDWLVFGLLAVGVLVELVGKLKASGKTTFAAHLVRAVLDHQGFLGFATKQTSVVWLTEERPPTFLETLKRAGLSHREDLHILHWHDVKTIPFGTVNGFLEVVPRITQLLDPPLVGAGYGGCLPAEFRVDRIQDGREPLRLHGALIHRHAVLLQRGNVALCRFRHNFDGRLQIDAEPRREVCRRLQRRLHILRHDVADRDEEAGGAL